MLFHFKISTLYDWVKYERGKSTLELLCTDVEAILSSLTIQRT